MSHVAKCRRFKRRRLDAPAAMRAMSAGGVGGYSSGGYSSGAALAGGYRSPAFGLRGLSAGGGAHLPPFQPIMAPAT